MRCPETEERERELPFGLLEGLLMSLDSWAFVIGSARMFLFQFALDCGHAVYFPVGLLNSWSWAFVGKAKVYRSKDVTWAQHHARFLETVLYGCKNERVLYSILETQMFMWLLAIILTIFRLQFSPIFGYHATGIHLHEKDGGISWNSF